MTIYLGDIRNDFEKLGTLATSLFAISKITFSSLSSNFTFDTKSGLVTDGVLPLTSALRFPIIVLGTEVAELNFEVRGQIEKQAILESFVENFSNKIELNHTRAAMHKAELRFETIFDQSPLSIQICSPDGHTLMVNPAWKKLWGISQEIIDSTILKDYNMLEDPNLEAQGVMGHIKKGFAGEVSNIPIITYDPKNLSFGGQVRSVEGWIYPLKDSKNRVKEIVLIHLDVTDKMKLLSDLGMERNRLEAVLRQLPVGVLVLDKASRTFSLTNPQIDEIQGQSFLGKAYSQDSYPKAFKPDGTEYSYEEFPLSKSIEHGLIVSNEEIEYHRKDGKVLQLNLSSAPIKNNEDEIVAAVIVSTDITAQKKAEHAQEFLAKVTSLLITTLDYEQTIFQIAEASVPAFADGCVIDLLDGPNLIRLLNKHKDEDKQRVLTESAKLFPITLQSPQPAAKVIRTGVPQLFKVIDQSGIESLTYSEAHAKMVQKIGIRSLISVPISIRGKAIGSISLIITSERPTFDDADLATALELARRASLAIENANLYRNSQAAILQRDEFISIASHELKTPITSMQLQLQSANKLMGRSESGLIEVSYVKKVTDLSIKQLNRINLLVEDMLDISRITSGKLAINALSTDLTQLLKDTVARYGNEFEKLDLTLTADLSEHVHTKCDEFRIEQVLNNLLTNAIRYGNKKPITVSLSRSEQTAIIKVSDQGPGIEPKDQERIFERFERAVSAKNISGLGLGLFISKQIIEQHHGTLTVESAPNLGSTFTITLPII